MFNAIKILLIFLLCQKQTFLFKEDRLYFMNFMLRQVQSFIINNTQLRISQIDLLLRYCMYSTLCLFIFLHITWLTCFVLFLKEIFNPHSPINNNLVDMEDTKFQNFKVWLILQIISVGFIISLLLRIIILKDHLFKIAAMSLTISIIFCCLNHMNNEQRLNYSYFVYLLVIYITTIALIKFVYLSYAQHRNKTLQAQRVYINNIVINFSLFYLVITILSYCAYFNVLNIILTEDKLFICAFIVIASLALLFLVDTIFFSNQQEAIRRKLFHIGPILTIPIIHQLNPQLLILILSVAFYVFFIIEYIRYHLKEINQNLNHHKISTLKYIDVLFIWMTKFNQRQIGFWFTHLFLILSLFFSYLMCPLLNQYQNIQHLVLILVAADGFAAIIGKSYGKIKIYQNKTVQGTISFIISFYIGYQLFINKQNGQSLTQKVFIAVMCGCGELFGGDADNIITILVFYIIKMQK